MIYMVSQNTGDGTSLIDVVFKPGTNIDEAQVLVQNRVSIAVPRLPEEVQRIGVTVKKKSPDLLMVVHLISPDGTFDQAYISNYATINIKDVLTRVDGVGDTIVFGARDYSMRIWLDPAEVQSRGLTASDVVASLRAANVQVAAGAINQPPATSPGGFQVAVQTLGRLSTPEQFSDIIVATDVDGRVTRVRDIGRVELGAYTYTTNAYLDGKVATAIGIFQRPGSNALKTAAAVIATMDQLSKNFPPDLAYRVAYNTTEFVQQSVDEVIRTLIEAVVLVVLVIILFLQTWRAAIIPVVAIPVSLIGTFFVLATFGFSLNNLTLFGLVLAIGIVVDDAIVVVENVERNLSEGMSPRDRGAQNHGRSRRGIDCDCLGTVRRIHPDCFHHRRFGFFLPAIRDYDRVGDDYFLFRVPHPVAGAGGASIAGARSRPKQIRIPEGDWPSARPIFLRLQPDVRQAIVWLR